jgi:hypothetical protein
MVAGRERDLFGYRIGNFFILLLLVLVFLPVTPWASSAPFSIEKPANWRELKEMFGVPYSLVGPKIQQANRPVITVTPAAHSQFPQDFFVKGEYFTSFQESKSEWLKSANGRVIRFYHDSSPKMKHLKKAYMTGVSYLLDSQAYLERSYYMPCSDNLYLVKYLLPLVVKDRFELLMERSVRGFQCK